MELDAKARGASDLHDLLEKEEAGASLLSSCAKAVLARAGPRARAILSWS